MKELILCSIFFIVQGILTFKFLSYQEENCKNEDPANVTFQFIGIQIFVIIPISIIITLSFAMTVFGYK